MASSVERLRADVAEASKSSLYGNGVLLIQVTVARKREKGKPSPSDHLLVGCYSEPSGLWLVDATGNSDKEHVSRDLDALIAGDLSFGKEEHRRIFWCQALMHGNGGGGGGSGGEGGAPSGGGFAAGAAATETPPSDAPAPRSGKRRASPSGAGGVGASSPNKRSKRS